MVKSKSLHAAPAIPASEENFQFALRALSIQAAWPELLDALQEAPTPALQKQVSKELMRALHILPFRSDGQQQSREFLSDSRAQPAHRRALEQVLARHQKAMLAYPTHSQVRACAQRMLDDSDPLARHAARSKARIYAISVVLHGDLRSKSNEIISDAAMPIPMKELILQALARRGAYDVIQSILLTPPESAARRPRAAKKVPAPLDDPKPLDRRYKRGSKIGDEYTVQSAHAKTVSTKSLEELLSAIRHPPPFMASPAPPVPVSEPLFQYGLQLLSDFQAGECISDLSRKETEPSRKAQAKALASKPISSIPQSRNSACSLVHEYYLNLQAQYMPSQPALDATDKTLAGSPQNQAATAQNLIGAPPAENMPNSKSTPSALQSPPAEPDALGLMSHQVVVRARVAQNSPGTSAFSPPVSTPSSAAPSSNPPMRRRWNAPRPPIAPHNMPKAKEERRYAHRP